MEISKYSEQLISALGELGLSDKEVKYRCKNLIHAESELSCINVVGERYFSLAHEIKSIAFLQQFGETRISHDCSHKPGCDLILNDKYYIECVCASAGDVEKNGFEKYSFKNTRGEVVDYGEKKNILYSRLTTVIKEKLDFYEKHKGESIPPDKPYIIFVGLGSLAYEMFAETNGFALTAILFGRGNPTLTFDSSLEKAPEWGYSHNEVLIKWNGQTIDCNIFCSPDYRCVSAILFSEADLNDKYDATNTWLFINPNATNELIKKDFEGLVYWCASQDGRYFARKRGHIVI